MSVGLVAQLQRLFVEIGGVNDDVRKLGALSARKPNLEFHSVSFMPVRSLYAPQSYTCRVAQPKMKGAWTLGPSCAFVFVVD